MSHPPFRFAISATFTAEPIQTVLDFWGRRLNSDFEFRFAPFNQLLQTLLDPAGEFASNHHGVNVVLLRAEDLGDFDTHDPARLERNLQQFIDVLRSAPARMSVPVLCVLCPPSPANAALAHETGARLAASLEDVPGVQFLSHEQVARLYPVADPNSLEGDRLGRIPYTELYFCALGTAIVRHAYSLLSAPFKVIALDCDNTLWEGICGEDGPQGVIVDPARRALQEFMVEQRERGMLLVMASKNNEQDVLETFQHHPAMPLQLRHFVSWRLNWESKAISLQSLAEELSVGLDSIVFVDDNPKECAEVSGSIPEVLTVALPENPADIPHFLDHVWAFDHPIVTEEDRHRNAYYAQAQEFGRELQKSADLNQFMAALDLQVRFEPLTAERLPRVAQLTQRTNQFNFTTIRRSEAEIQSLVRDDAYECLTVHAADRFGDYGLVGVILFRDTDAGLDVDTMLLSCRALGRGVEHRMLAHLGAEALRRGQQHVSVHLRITQKNQPAQQFLREVGAPGSQPVERGVDYRFAAEALNALEWKPSAQPAVERPAPSRSTPAPRRFFEFTALARTLSTPEQILEAMRREARGGRELEAGQLSETESRLAVIWSDLLQTHTLSATDNFFDLGGHSLLAVLLIVRVREAFGIELPIDDVYSATLTLGELAAKIEMYQLGSLNPADYESLLSEIEGLSDEEVERLLAEEDPGALRS